MVLTTILFVLGFVFLIKGADYLVSGGGSLAKRFQISNIVIGLTIVAFGTSAPELIVNIISSLSGNAGLAVGNILGSNISNIMLILGAAAIIYPLKVHKNTVWREIPFSMLAALVLFVVANDKLIDGYEVSIISRSEGLILIGFFIIFLYYTFQIARSNETGFEDEEVKRLPVFQSILYIIFGMIGLFFGGEWIVNGATAYAELFGLSPSVIGLTVVAIGTSLPELATSIIAATKKQTDIAIGNVVGSNIFNLFWILGVSSSILPIPFNPINNADLGMVVFSTALLFLFLFIGEKRYIQRWQGGVFLLIYVLYTVSIVIRG